jgi:DNA-binding beta-propeller fold protein YncE
MKNGHVWATVPVGKNPWDVTVDRDTGYAYVGNSGDNTISVFKEGAFIKTIPLPADKGYKPWRIAIHPQTHDVYVLDRSSYIKNKGLNRREEVCEQPWLHILR